MWELNEVQLKQLGEFLSNLTLILIGTSLITPFFINPNEINPVFVAGGLFLSIVSFTLTMVVLNGVKQK